MLQRWLATAGLLALFFLRIVLAQGVSISFFNLSHLSAPSSERRSYASFSGTLVSSQFWVLCFLILMHSLSS